MNVLLGWGGVWGTGAASTLTLTLTGVWWGIRRCTGAASTLTLTLHLTGLWRCMGHRSCIHTHSPSHCAFFLPSLPHYSLQYWWWYLGWSNQMKSASPSPSLGSSHLPTDPWPAIRSLIASAMKGRSRGPMPHKHLNSNIQFKNGLLQKWRLFVGPVYCTVSQNAVRIHVSQSCPS